MFSSTTTTVFFASLLSLGLAAPTSFASNSSAELLVTRQTAPKMCSLMGYTAKDGSIKVKTGQGNGFSDVKWGFELRNVPGNDRFWSCASDGDCNPTAMGGQFFSKERTGMNTEIKWETFGNLGNQCQCVVDGVTYPGKTTSGDYSVYASTETCICDFPCDTGNAGKFGITMTDKPAFKGESVDFFLANEFCYDLHAEAIDEYGKPMAPWYQRAESISVNKLGRQGSCMFYTDFGCTGVKGGPIRHSGRGDKYHGDLAKAWNGNKIASMKCWSQYCVEGDKNSGCERG